MENSLPTTSGAAPLSIMEQTRQQAEINLLFIQEEIGRRVLDPTMHTKDLFSAGEHSYKVSGMAAKQEAKTDTSRFIFNIIKVGGLSVDAPQVGATFEGSVGDVQTLIDEAPDLLGEVPAYMLATTGNLMEIDV